MGIKQPTIPMGIFNNYKVPLNNSAVFSLREKILGDASAFANAHPDITGLKGLARCTSLSQIFFSALTHYVRGGEKNFP
jgi:hypothetical protein